MSTGRQPKTPYLKALEGGAAHRPIKEGLEASPVATLPSPPRGLGNWGSRFWRVYGKVLIERGVFDEMDQPLFLALCNAYESYMSAWKQVKAGGAVVLTKNGNPIQNPYVAIQKQALKDMTTLGAKFGFSPTDRARLGIAGKEQDAIEKWFFGPGEAP